MGEWRPRLLHLDRAADREIVASLIDGARLPAVHDTLDMQLLELMAIRAPASKSRPAELAAMARNHLAGRPIHEYGTWVFYPWSGRLVHLLPEQEFFELRSARNHYKITPDEQAVLAGKRVGIIGLSVGQAGAVTMAQEGVARAFRLADFDGLSLSNMNRLRASVSALGLPKVLIAAREMSEIDPYLNIEVFTDGINEANVDAFLIGSGPSPEPLDLLVEECDDLFAKILVRERAKAMRIPVLMDTNERGMLDVERFDLDGSLPVLHGLLRDVRAGDVKSLSTRDKIPYMLAILGQEHFSPRFVPSLMEIEETIGSWPQLASGVALGAALVTDAGRRILLGQFQESGRYFVDLDELVRDGKRAPLAAPGALDAAVSSLALKGPVLQLPSVQRELTREDVRRLVQHGIEAPSGGNVQPWRFRARGNRVRCLIDDQRSNTILDYEQTASVLAIGAAVENMDLAARAAGLVCEVKPFPDPRDSSVVCDVHFRALPGAPKEPSSLAACISARATNRKLARRQALSPEHQRAMVAAAESAGARLRLVTEPAQLDALGRLLGAGDRVRFLSRQLHHEMMSEIRWTPEEVERTRDGVDIATLEFSRTDLAGLRLSRNYANLRFLLEIGGGRALENSARDAIKASSAVGLLTMHGVGRDCHFQGGRAMERVWLTATSLGLGFQPWTSILYLWSRLERGDGEGLEENQIPLLRKLRGEFLDLLRPASDETEILLLRLAHAGPVSARSLRRPIQEVLEFEEG